eukprot:jgi/Chlat1/7028/Chrsp56S06664
MVCTIVLPQIDHVGALAAHHPRSGTAHYPKCITVAHDDGTVYFSDSRINKLIDGQACLMATLNTCVAAMVALGDGALLLLDYQGGLHHVSAGGVKTVVKACLGLRPWHSGMTRDPANAMVEVVGTMTTNPPSNSQPIVRKRLTPIGTIGGLVKYKVDGNCVKGIEVGSYFETHGPSSHKTLAMDMLALFKNTDLPSGKVVFVVEGKEVRALKELLAQRCEYFCRMFWDTWVLDRVHVSEVSADVFGAVLEYLYTNNLPTTMDAMTAVETMRYADQILHKDLALVRASAMMWQDNVCELCAYATRHGLADLRKKCVSHIYCHLANMRVHPSLDLLYADTLRDVLRSMNVRRKTSLTGPTAPNFA